ncbi:hypothetical protein M0805_004147 [Coniferiporia weirii]|nr:hypothetical protein M0805_004147 [Coniferiporia weirii]
MLKLHSEDAQCVPYASIMDPPQLERRLKRQRSQETDGMGMVLGLGSGSVGMSESERMVHPSDPKPPVQVLMYSTYGPNNEDHLVQATYKRTPDDIEWTGSRPLWGNTFKSPIVAVFDVLHSPNRRHPIVLLQPQPRLQDLIPNFDFASNSHDSSSLDVGATYVGLVEDGGSLFALSPSHYPLAVFAQNNYLFARQHRRLPSIDAPPGYIPADNTAEVEIDMDTATDWDAGLLDLPPDVDGMTCMRKAIERCTDNRWDRACVVGKQPVAASGQSRLSRLLPSRSVPEPAEQIQSQMRSSEARDAMLEYYAGARVGEANFSKGPLAGTRTGILGMEGGRGKQALSGGAMVLVVFLVGMWYLTRKVKQEEGRTMERKAVTIEHQTSASASEEPVSKVDEPAAGRADVHAVHVVDFAEHVPIPSPSTPNGYASPTMDVPVDDTNKLPAQKSPDTKQPTDKTTNLSAIEDVEGDDESDREGDNLATPGKKKGTRRRN